MTQVKVSDNCDNVHNNTTEKNMTVNLIIELGCGCGLVGFTLLQWLHNKFKMRQLYHKQL